MLGQGTSGPPVQEFWRDGSAADLDVCLLGKSTIASYVDCIEYFRKRGFKPVTMLELSRAPQQERLFAMRHDVDHSLVYARVMAEIEARHGVRSTYYLLPPGDYEQSRNYYGTVEGDQIGHSPELASLATQIVELGHEIGIHHDFVQLSQRTGRSVNDLFAGEIAWFASIGIEVLGVCSHGSRYARRNEFTNYHIFAATSRPEPGRVIEDGGWSFELGTVDMSELGIEYEAYWISSDLYVADVGSAIGITDKRTGDYIRVDDGIAADLDAVMPEDRVASASRVIMLTHPEWWQVTASARGAMRFEPEPDNAAATNSVRMGVREPVCNASCHAAVERAPQTLAKIVNFASGDDEEPHLAATIELDRLRDNPLIDAPEVEDDMVTGLFTARLFAPDLAAIVKAGNGRRAQPLPTEGLKGVEEFGGAPDETVPFVWPRCGIHWTFVRGLFARADRRRQGTQRVDGQLLAYLTVRRLGELVQLTGFGTYLADPFDMDALIADTIRAVANGDSVYTHGVRCLVLGPWPTSRVTAERLQRVFRCEPVELHADVREERLVELMGRPYA